MDAVQRSADGTTCPELVVGIISTQSCPKDLQVPEYQKLLQHSQVSKLASTES